jgi:hypothetical protein
LLDDHHIRRPFAAVAAPETGIRIEDREPLLLLCPILAAKEIARHLVIEIVMGSTLCLVDSLEIDTAGPP